MERYGAIEAGGTKFVCAIGTSPDDVLDMERFPTTTPHETLGAVADWFGDHDPVTALGIASFGPVELRPDHTRYGFITSTPKQHWRNADVVGSLRALGVPIGFDTDVNGAALAEGAWGAANGLDTFVYVTVGTGIGVGAIVNGAPTHGLVHSEMGHVVVRRAAGDDFPGICPYHGDCWEGMANGPALAARFGTAAQHLTGEDLIAAAELAAFYIADGVRNIVYTIAPQRVVIGGGVAELPGLFDLIRRRLVESLAGYPGLLEHESEDFVVPSALEGVAGLYGAFLLAAGAAR